ncbi:MAG: toll/interleukin-1 receptor domain-containing protein [Chloroflexi bacterium]|nr:toll/interleukin-1 receptor domain-containing protein [Chloroflexota bacterium]
MGGSPTLPPLRVFINYRREDADSAALLLCERLEQEFGAANVYLDVKALQAGTNWLEQIMAHGERGDAFLALIGRRWLTSLQERQRRPPGDDEDFVMLELEFALREWRGTVVPVLVGGATMPAAASLPSQLGTSRVSRRRSFATPRLTRTSKS